MKKQKTGMVSPPRNPLVSLALFKPAGAHGRSHKAQRTQDKQNLKRHWRDDSGFCNSPVAA